MNTFGCIWLFGTYMEHPGMFLVVVFYWFCFVSCFYAQVYSSPTTLIQEVAWPSSLCVSVKKPGSPEWFSF